MNGNTALHDAISCQQYETAIQLIIRDDLGNDVDVNATNQGNVTPLHLAVANRIAIDCLDDRISIFRKHSRFKNCLASYNFAISARDEAAPTEVSALGGNIRSDKDMHSLVQMLINAGADVNATDDYGCSPIHCAVYIGDIELVKILIDAGADINNQNEVGASPLHDAVLCCNEAMVQLLLDHGARVDLNPGPEDAVETALYWASMLNWSNSLQTIIRRLLEFRSDINDIYNFYDHDIRNPDPTNPNATLPNVRSSFDFILMYGDINLIQYCIEEHGARLTWLDADENQDENESYALKFAVYNEDPRVMNLVLETGITKSYYGLTALHLASCYFRPQHVRQLITNGADVNIKADVRGEPWADYTPLALSLEPVLINHQSEYEIDRPNAAEDKRQVIKLLLECGADLNQTIKTVLDERTVFELAMLNRYNPDEIDETERLIIEHVAEVEARTNKKVLDNYNMDLLNEYSESVEYYDKCEAELTAMRNSKIAGTCITHHSVLTEPLDVMARYVRNEEFVNNFKANYRTAYPTYAQQLTDKFEAAVAKQQKSEQVLFTLSKMLPFAELNFLPFEIISKYLNEEDVNLFIDAYRLSH